MNTADVIIVGAGIAGASLAYELSKTARVFLLEAEAQPGRHATGRSAAMFTETYGNAVVRALTRASRPFYESPPAGFPRPLLADRGTLFIASEETRDDLDEVLADPDVAAATRPVAQSEALALVPALKPEAAVVGALEWAAQDIDTGALLQAYLASARANGAELVTDARVASAAHEDGAWRVATSAGDFAAPVLVDAAGAWADHLAELAGVAPVGLSPKRRTAILIDAPDGADVSAWPMIMAADESFYFKPDAGRILISPADETPSAPCDAAPEEEDVALAAWKFEEATGAEVRRIAARWAGLRTFALDRSPVVGFDPTADGFFWLAGQGGYGFQTAPALSRLSAALIARSPIPADLADIDLAELDVARFR